MNENEKIGPLNSTSIAYDVVKKRDKASIFDIYAKYPKDRLRDTKKYTTPNSKSKAGVVEHLDLTDETGLIATAERVSSFKSAYETTPRTFSVKSIPKLLQDLAPILEASSKVGKEMNAAKEFVYKEISNQIMDLFQLTERSLGRQFNAAAVGIIKREDDEKMVDANWGTGYEMSDVSGIWRTPHDSNNRLREHVTALNLTGLTYSSILDGTTTAVTEAGERQVRYCRHLATLATQSPLMAQDGTVEAISHVLPGTLASIAAGRYLNQIERPKMYGLKTPESEILDKLSKKRYAQFSFIDIPQVKFIEYANNDLYPRIKNYSWKGSTATDAIITPMILKPAATIWDGIHEQRLTALFPKMQELPIENIVEEMTSMAKVASTTWIKLDSHFYLRLDSRDPNRNGITMQIFGVLDVEFKHHTERGFSAVAWKASEFDNDSILNALNK